MYPYWLLFLVFTVGALQWTRAAAHFRTTLRPESAIPGAQQRVNPLFIAGVALIALLVGFRYKVGADWTAYVWIFEDIRDLDLEDALFRTDPGYGFLNWLANAAGLDIWAVNLVCGIIFAWGLMYFAKGQPNPWLLFVVAIPYLVIGVGMGYSRQAVAIGLVSAGLAAISKGSFRHFTLLILLAAMFHSTAIIVLPVIGLSYARNRAQALFFGALATGVAYYLLLQPKMEHFEAGYIERKYEAAGASIRLAMNVFPAVLFLGLSKRFRLNVFEHTAWRNFSLSGLVAGVAYFFVESSVIIDRLALYVIPLQLFVFSRLPYALGSRDRPNELVLLLTIFYSALVQLIWLNFSNHSIYWIPYQLYPLF